MRKITKSEVLAHIGSGNALTSFGAICVEMARTLQRAINVGDVRVLLKALVREGAVEKQTRDNRLYYRKV